MYKGIRFNPALPRDESGAPEVPPEEHARGLQDLATEHLGLPEVCRHGACRRARKCALPGAPCIAEFRPALDPVLFAAGHLILARERFLAAMAGDAEAGEAVDGWVWLPETMTADELADLACDLAEGWEDEAAD